RLSDRDKRRRGIVEVIRRSRQTTSSRSVKSTWRGSRKCSSPPRRTHTPAQYAMMASMPLRVCRLGAQIRDDLGFALLELEQVGRRRERARIGDILATRGKV